MERSICMYDATTRNDGILKLWPVGPFFFISNKPPATRRLPIVRTTHNAMRWCWMILYIYRFTAHICVCNVYSVYTVGESPCGSYELQSLRDCSLQYSLESVAPIYEPPPQKSILY